MNVDGWTKPAALATLPSYPGFFDTNVDSQTVVFRVGLHTVMMCDRQKNCWKLRPGWDSDWVARSPMLYVTTDNLCSINFGSEIVLMSGEQSEPKS